MTKVAFDQMVQSLMGKKILGVTYHGIEYEDGDDHFFDDPRFDSLDQGLQWELDDGRLINLVWGWEFAQYGLSLTEGSIHQVLKDSVSRDVGLTGRWRDLLAAPIQSTEIGWSQGFHEVEKPTYPQSLVLGFEHDRHIVVSALEIGEDSSYTRGMDHITVFDDLEIAQRFNAL